MSDQIVAITLNDAPFSELYKCASPNEFVALFSQELPQTIAYILSFCPRKRYARKVISIIKEREEKAGRIDPSGEASFTIREYLLRCHKDAFDANFTRLVELEVSKMLETYNITRFQKFRKRLISG